MRITQENDELIVRLPLRELKGLASRPVLQTATDWKVRDLRVGDFIMIDEIEVEVVAINWRDDGTVSMDISRTLSMLPDDNVEYVGY